jgi:lipopolysaccharide biosynthesis glycosyltransferase
VTLHVACAVEGDYVAHSAALVHSALAHGGGEEVRFHYLHGPGVSWRARRRLARIGPIEFHRIDSSRVAGLPVRGYFTAAMWFRLLLPELVDADRALYLDVDTIVADDLGPLFATELGDAYVAAVENVHLPWLPDRAADLGLSAYFNSGVLLLNLAALRADDAAGAVLAFARERGEELLWPDQDALNYVLGARRVALHPRWNTMNAVLSYPEGEATFGAEAVAEARRAPGIRHFEGPGDNKPWAEGFAHPHGELYWRHRQATPFRVRGRPLSP